MHFIRSVIALIILAGCNNTINSDKRADNSSVDHVLEKSDSKACKNCCNKVFDSLAFPIKSEAFDLLKSYSGACDTIISINTRDSSDTDTLYIICTKSFEVQIARTNGIYVYDYADVRSDQIILYDHIIIGTTKEKYFTQKYRILNCENKHVYSFYPMSDFYGADYYFEGGVLTKCIFTTSNPHEIFDCKQQQLLGK